MQVSLARVYRVMDGHTGSFAVLDEQKSAYSSSLLCALYILDILTAKSMNQFFYNIAIALHLVSEIVDEKFASLLELFKMYANKVKILDENVNKLKIFNFQWTLQQKGLDCSE